MSLLQKAILPAVQEAVALPRRQAILPEVPAEVG
jgi:hypothetical protein